MTDSAVSWWHTGQATTTQLSKIVFLQERLQGLNEVVGIEEQ